MLIRLLLAASALVLAMPSWAQTVAGSQGVPTTHAVFVVLCDDCGTTQDARYGASGAGVSTEMPALDSLDSQGTRFTAFYVNPLCATTRASLVFGQYNFRAGVYGGPAGGWPYGRDSSLGSVSDAAGVDSYTTGKYGGGGSADYSGWGAMEDGWTAMEVFNDQTPTDYSVWTRTSGTQAQFQALGAPPQSNPNTTAETVFMDTRHVDDAIALYRARDRSKNAVFYVAPHAIHDTAGGAYDPTKPPPHTGTSCTDGSDTCRERAQTRFDEDFARLLAAVDQTRDFVILAGDNGAAPGPTCKGSLNECGIRVPAYVYGPGVTAAATFGEVVHIVDVWATALDLAGVTSYGGASVVDGYSFADQVVSGYTCGLSGQCWADRPDEIAYVADGENHTVTGDGDRAIVMETSVGRYKLIVDYTTAGVALFDLSSYNAGTGAEPSDICGGDDDCTGISGDDLTAYNETCAVYEAAEAAGADCPSTVASGDATFTGPCETVDTDGDRLNDCYCTRVRGDGGIATGSPDPNGGTSDELYDANLIICMDMDAPSAWDHANAASYEGDGAPDYGPDYDHTGGGTFRGDNSYWVRNWNYPQTPCIWPNGVPASPDEGIACSFGNGCGAPWFVDDVAHHQEEAISTVDGVKGTCMNFITDNGTSIDAAVTYTGGPSANGTVIGNAALEAIQPRNVEGPGPGIKEGLGNHTEWGQSVWLWWGNNHQNAEVLDGNAIKGDEATQNGAGNGEWFWGYSSNTPIASFPFSGFRWADGNCAAATASAVAHEGTFGCTGDNLALYFYDDDYTRPVDFFDKAINIRAHVTGMGTSSYELKVWECDTLRIHISGIDGTQLRNQFYNGYLIDMNYNSPDQFTEPVTRLYDNLHLTNGPPPACQPAGWPS